MLTVLFNKRHHTDLLFARCALNITLKPWYSKVEREKRLLTRITQDRFCRNDTNCQPYSIFMYLICHQTGTVTVNMPSSHSFITNISLLILSCLTNWRCTHVVATYIFIWVDFVSTVAIACFNKVRFFVEWNFNSSCRRWINLQILIL